MLSDTNMYYEYPSVRHKLVRYPYQVWMFSILIAPLPDILIMPASDNFDFLPDVSFAGYFITVFLITLVLIPAMIIYMLLFWRLSNSNLENFRLKILLAFIGIGSLYAELMLIQSIFFHNSILSFAKDSHFILFSFTFLFQSMVLSLKEK